MWTLARLKANAHVNPVGTEIESVEVTNGINKITYKPINASYAATNNGVFGGEKNLDVQSFFDYNLRRKLNLAGGGANSSFVDVLSLNPSLLSIFIGVFFSILSFSLLKSGFKTINILFIPLITFLIYEYKIISFSKYHFTFSKIDFSLLAVIFLIS